MTLQTQEALAKDVRVPESSAKRRGAGLNVGLLTGGFDRPYAFGLSTALAASGVAVDVIGSDDVDSPEMHTTPGIDFINLQGAYRPNMSAAEKVLRILIFYVRLLKYAATAQPRILHILWNTKLLLFDRTLLMLYYKLLGKRVVFTAHNVNAGRRDGKNTLLNRLTLKMQYSLCDHIFVHTESMKTEMAQEFGIANDAVTVIPFGINNSVPDTQLTSAEARKRLGIAPGDKAILFYGAIRPYKGLEHLVDAFQRIAPRDQAFRLIIAGEPKKDGLEYTRAIQQTIANHSSKDRVIQRLEFIPDAETELYFKAADILVLPYTLVFQSGVLFLSYSFGLPVIAADVGSFRGDIIPGETGYLCRSCDPADLAAALETYFESELFKTLERRRRHICDFARSRNSWDVVSEKTCNVYAALLGNS
jgi:glycosyltransferase involved in cell wall biosynthesis